LNIPLYSVVFVLIITFLLVGIKIDFLSFVKFIPFDVIDESDVWEKAKFENKEIESAIIN
jgi:hypothetical protein